MGKETSPLGSGSRAGGRARGSTVSSNQAMKEIVAYKSGLVSGDAMRKTIDGLRRTDAIDVARKVGVRIRSKVSAGTIRQGITKQIGLD